MKRQQTPAEAGRQRVRGRGGRYAEMPRCDGGCGRAVNVQGNYLSHPMTDCTDANGANFGGDALALCAKCGKAAQRADLQTVKAWSAFVAANEARRST